MTIADIKPTFIMTISNTKKPNSTWTPVFSRLLNRWIPPFILFIISDQNLIQLALLIQKQDLESKATKLHPLDAAYLTIIAREFQFLYAEAHHANQLIDTSHATCSSILQLLSDVLKDERNTFFQTLAGLFGYRFPYSFVEHGVPPKVMELYPKVTELRDCFIKAITLKAVAGVLLMAEDKAVVSDDAFEEIGSVTVDTRHLLLGELVANNMGVYEQMSTGAYDGVEVMEALKGAESLVEEKLGVFWWLKESSKPEVPKFNEKAVEEAILEETEVLGQVWALKRVLEL
ncbi:Protein of unknown function [Pyronema omphalodes CBS 100304]|uniref:Uncharacterized protein n=1 Tax=Pyronema omphalodes (strain CBS 100304) TaxID=1076935 RepID=U4KYA6_PYROM|nr:Protein of unknown function [Pyronema omphalodes CBS 100304]